MRRSGHPSRPRAMTCCFFASLKTLLISTKATALRRNQRPRASSSLAGFEVTLIGRFWVTPEAWILTCAAAALMAMLTVIGLTSDDTQAQRPNLARWVVHFALCFAALPASFVATALPPCMLLIYLALLCAVQVIVTTTETVEERRVESEELELVAEL